ncbi:MAG: hypothetical protein PUC11_02330 [Elusimicrobia bacterium]|nr:hypothetical protein [Elusimicrobiota bacterium]
MGELGDFYRDCNEYVKQRRAKRAEYWEPRLQSVGAEYKAPGIWEYNGWICYPSKGFAMLKKNNRIRTSLRKLLSGREL